MIDQAPSIDQLVRRASGLYTLPAVAMKVLELTGRETVDSRALKACVENDPALTGKLLKVVNSSLFGLSSPVHDLGQALALLGTKPLKLLVLGFSLPDRLFAGVGRHRLAAYWRDALTKAVASREICQRWWGGPGDEAFIAGLLHDIGILVLLQDLRQPYLDLLEEVDRHGTDLEEAERAMLGFSHSTLSARLLDAWGLPKPLVGAIAATKSLASLRPLAGQQAVLPRVLHLADLLTQLVARHRIAVLPDLLEAGQAYCQLTRSALNELVGDLEGRVSQLAEVLSLTLPDGLGFEEVLAEAHARLAEQAEAAVLGGARGAAVPNRSGHRRPEAAPRRSDAPRAVAARSPASPIRAGNTESAPALVGQLTAVITHCRARRRGVSLLLIEKMGKAERGGAEGANLLQEVSADLKQAAAMHHLLSGMVVSLGATRLAVILPECERHTAVAIAHRLAGRADAPHGDRAEPSSWRTDFRAGVAYVAVPSKNFRAADLIESAQRCLFAARTSGGSAVKSIEVY